MTEQKQDRGIRRMEREEKILAGLLAKGEGLKAKGIGQQRQTKGGWK